MWHQRCLEVPPEAAFVQDLPQAVEPDGHNGQQHDYKYKQQDRAELHVRPQPLINTSPATVRDRRGLIKT